MNGGARCERGSGEGVSQVSPIGPGLFCVLNPRVEGEERSVLAGKGVSKSSSATAAKWSRVGRAGDVPLSTVAMSAYGRSLSDVDVGAGEGNRQWPVEGAVAVD